MLSELERQRRLLLERVNRAGCRRAYRAKPTSAARSRRLPAGLRRDHRPATCTMCSVAQQPAIAARHHHRRWPRLQRLRAVRQLDRARRVLRHAHEATTRSTRVLERRQFRRGPRALSARIRSSSSARRGHPAQRRPRRLRRVVQALERRRGRKCWSSSTNHLGPRGQSTDRRRSTRSAGRIELFFKAAQTAPDA